MSKIICENKIENVNFKLSSNDNKIHYQHLYVESKEMNDIIQIAPCDYFTAVNAVMFSETLEEVKERFNRTWAEDHVNGFINYVIRTNGSDKMIIYFNNKFESVNVGDEVITTTSTFSYDNVAGTFANDLNAYADVDVEHVRSDYSEYDPRTCRDGGNYGYDYYVVTKIHEVGEL